MNEPDTTSSRASARSRMLELVHAVPTVQAIHVAARLGIADLLTRGPQRADDLAREVDVHGPSLHRILRFLANMDIFAEDASGRFSLTPSSELLRRGVPGSVYQAALHCGEPWTWRKWGELHHTVRTGQPGFEKAHGMAFFDYLATYPEARQTFDGLMKELSAAQIRPIIEAYDFSRFRTIVDVGGGHGVFLSAIRARSPGVTGVSFDLPEVAAAVAAGGGPPDGVEVVVGNFFESVPAGGDAYMMKWILHDWGDEEVVRILANCRRAMGDDGTLLVVEMVIPDVGRHESKAMDVFMMVTLPGRERTQAEFRDLFRRAGFELARVVPAGAMSVLEGRPV